MMRWAIGLHLLWKKLEVVICALTVPGLLFESSIANGWAYGGGWIGLLRGFILEGLTYIMARQAFLYGKGKRWPGCVLCLSVAVIATFVSAASNLGWVMSGHELAGVFSAMGRILGDGALYQTYQFLLAILLPVGVGVIALVDLDRFFQHALEQDHLDNHALLVDERHMHRTAYLKAQRAQRRDLQQEYREIAKVRAQSFVEEARTGNLTFGAGGGVPVAQMAQLEAPQTRALVPSGPMIEGQVWPADEDRWSSSPGR